MLVFLKLQFSGQRVPLGVRYGSPVAVTLQVRLSVTELLAGKLGIGKPGGLCSKIKLSGLGHVAPPVALNGLQARAVQTRPGVGKSCTSAPLADDGPALAMVSV